jgi:hypothetical protein
MPSIYETQKKADEMAKKYTDSPKQNPAGKGQFEGKVRVARDEPVVAIKPDASHAARLRGNKARKSWEARAKGQ